MGSLIEPAPYGISASNNCAQACVLGINVLFSIKECLFWRCSQGPCPSASIAISVGRSSNRSTWGWGCHHHPDV